LPCLAFAQEQHRKERKGARAGESSSLPGIGVKGWQAFLVLAPFLSYLGCSWAQAGERQARRGARTIKACHSLTSFFSPGSFPFVSRLPLGTSRARQGKRV